MAKKYSSRSFIDLIAAGVLKLVIISAPFVCVATNASAGVFSIRMRGFADRQPTSECLSQLSEIADEFVAQSAVTLMDISCVTDEWKLTEARITYSAQEPVNTYSTDFEFEGGAGWYNTPADCLAGLQREIEVFQRQTGLRPFAHYCYRAPTLDSPVYRSEIFAVNKAPGNPINRRFVSSVPLGHQVIDPQNLNSFLRTSASQFGIELVNTRIAPEIAAWGIRVAYYGPKRIAIRAREIGFHVQDTSTTGSPTCEDAAAAANAEWPDENIPASFFCSLVGNNVERLFMTWWSENGFADDDFTLTDLTPDYPGYAACDSEKTRVVQGLRDAGEKLMLAICDLDGPPPWNIPPKQYRYRLSVVTQK